MKLSSDLTDTDGMTFEEMEQLAIDRLHEKFLANTDRQVAEHSFSKTLGIESEDAGRRLFRRLQTLGAIDREEDVIARGLYKRGQGGPVYFYTISPRIIDIISERHAAAKLRSQPLDRVSAAEQWARSHTVWAMAIVVIVSLTVLVTLANQLLELIDKIFGK